MACQGMESRDMAGAQTVRTYLEGKLTITIEIEGFEDVMSIVVRSWVMCNSVGERKGEGDKIRKRTQQTYLKG